jgi:hypothetical protein
MIGRAARNTEGQVVMYADAVTESMRAAIDETDRRRGIQEAYNREHGIEPQTIVKSIRDINQRLRAVAETTAVYRSDRGELADKALSQDNEKAIERLIVQMEAEMRAAARELEFERAAALRDEIQQIRLRVLEQDQSVVVARAAERAARDASASRSRNAGSVVEVTEVTVLPADEEPAGALEGDPDADRDTAAAWFPGIRDEHEDDGGWQARWLDRPTWDRTVTPNVRRRTGQRPGGRRRGY